MTQTIAAFALALALAAPAGPARAFDARAYIDQQIRAHPQLTGAYVLEKGEEALLARAWLADNARSSIDVQYFIWSTDNVGILASEAILRAAQRGRSSRYSRNGSGMPSTDELLLSLILFGLLLLWGISGFVD